MGNINIEQHPSSLNNKEKDLIKQNIRPQSKMRIAYLSNSPSTKTNFFKIPQPKEEEQFPEFEEEQEKQKIKSIKKIEEVKVKWRNFLKMRQSDFQTQYQIKKQLGRGGFGCVYKVKGKFNGTIRAAKKIKKSDLDAKEHQRLFNQVSILQSLDHPNIVKLYEVYDMKDQYILIMELCEGGELFQRIAKKKVTLDKIPKIMRQLLEVLAYTHSKGVVHRDIKPENILINKETNEIKIIDFGIATVKTSSNTVLKSRVGTPYYIAPEVLLKEYNQKCDIWAAGIVFYMMIFHKPPYKGANQMEIIQGILNDQIYFQGKIWSETPTHAKDLIVKMLKKQPRKRISAREALKNPWLEKLQTNTSLQKLDFTTQNMTKFGFKNRLEAVVYTYCISQLVTTEEKKGLQQIFKQVDTDHNGIISLSELRSILRESVKDEQRIRSIMRLIDLDGSGQIQYTEFLISALNPKGFLTEEHYTKAFDFFDIDHSGDISYEEIAKFLQGQESQEAILSIFNQIDSNGDGTLSREEFVDLFIRSAQKTIKEISTGKSLINQKNSNVQKKIVKERHISIKLPQKDNIPQ